MGTPISLYMMMGTIFQEFVSLGHSHHLQLHLGNTPQGFTFNVKGMSVFANTDWTLNSL